MNQADLPASRSTLPETRVGFVLLPGFSMASFSLAVEALVVANQCRSQPAYSYHIYGDDRQSPGRVVSSNGIAIETQGGLDDCRLCDQLILCSYRHAPSYDNPLLFRHLRQIHQSGGRIAALSCGAFVLARAGLLHEKSCTLVAEYQSTFSELYPYIPIQEGVYTVTGNILTCAGGMAALDMLLYIIGSDYGKALAIQVSDLFIQDRIRSHDDMVASKRYLTLRMKSPVLGAAVEVMEKNLEAPYAIRQLAAQIGTTPRNLEAVFKRHENTTPTHYYQNLRLKHARHLIEETHLPLSVIAQATGFSSQSHFGTCFKALFGMTPAKLRANH